MASDHTQSTFELPVDEWRTPPTEPVAPPPSRNPDLLPFGEREPREFEKSCLLIAEQVVGLSDVRLYGVPGQPQHGIDLVGSAPDGATHVWQMKRYAAFDENDLEHAVATFATGDLPFAAARLVICVSTLAERVQVSDTLQRLRLEHPFEIKLYDQRELSALLRHRPDVVAQMFSQGWADVFCLGHRPERPRRSTTDVLGAAVLRGPFEGSGVKPILVAADSTADPATAARLLDEAATKIEDLGLMGVAEGLRHRQAELLREAGEIDQATSLLFMLAWRPFAQGRPDRGSEALGRLRAMSKTDDAQPSTTRLIDVLDHALQWYARPAWDLDPLAARVDELRATSLEAALPLAVWLAETLLVDARAAAPERAELLLRGLHNEWVDADVDESLLLRLHMGIADLVGDWDHLVDLARLGQVDRRQAVWILARQARHLARIGQVKAASSAYREAMNAAFAAEEPALAEPLLRSWWRSEVTGARTLTQQTFDAAKLGEALGSDPRQGLLARQYDAYEIGMRKRAEDKAPQALRWLKSALRDAAITGALEDERLAASAVGDLLCEVGEIDAGVQFLISAGNEQRLRTRLPARRWVSPGDAVESPLRWVRAAAWTTVALQGELVPDASVESLVDKAVADMSFGDVGPMAPSVALSAHKAVAVLADFVDDDGARQALQGLEPCLQRTPGRYYRTDDPHADIATAVHRTKPHLRHVSRHHVIELLREPDVGRRIVRRLADLQHPDRELIDAVRQLSAEGSAQAVALLHAWGEDSPEFVEWAAARVDRWLERPPRKPGSWGLGTDVAEVAHYARYVDEERRLKFAALLLTLAQDTGDAEQNRVDALRGLAALATALDTATRTDLWPELIGLSRPNGELSSIDEHLLAGQHPLSTMRINIPIGVLEAAAARAAAVMAVTDRQIEQSRELVLGLLPAIQKPATAHEVARALVQLGKPDSLDLRFLVASPFGSLRQVAALWWVPGLHPSLQEALVTDDEAVVRRVFAEHLRDVAPDDEVDSLLNTLRHDPVRSVRRAAGAVTGDGRR